MLQLVFTQVWLQSNRIGPVTTLTLDLHWQLSALFFPRPMSYMGTVWPEAQYEALRHADFVLKENSISPLPAVTSLSSSSSSTEWAVTGFGDTLVLVMHWPAWSVRGLLAPGMWLLILMWAASDLLLVSWVAPISSIFSLCSITSQYYMLTRTFQNFLLRDPITTVSHWLVTLWLVSHTDYLIPYQCGVALQNGFASEQNTFITTQYFTHLNHTNNHHSLPTKSSPDRAINGEPTLCSEVSSTVEYALRKCMIHPPPHHWYSHSNNNYHDDVLRVWWQTPQKIY